LLKLAITRRGGGGMVKLWRGIEGGVDRWSVCHGTEVGGGSVRCGGMRGEAGALNPLGEEEGLCPPGWLVGLHGLHRPTGRLGQLGQKPGKNSFEFK
jgi:hypothetical protein